MKALTAVFLAVVLSAPPSTLATAPPLDRTALPALVLLVRHGEKASHQGNDPPLTAAGVERAQALAVALRDAGVAAIVTTQLRRTRDTAQPLAVARGLTPEIIPVRPEWDDLDAHVRAVLTALRRHPGEVVLVVGHQNTVPEIIAALGGPHLPRICDPIFGNLYALVPGPGPARLVTAHYGAPDPEVGPDCK